MRLTELLTPQVVKIGLQSVDKEECFEEMIDLLVRAGKIEDRERALEALYARERMRTTGIGRGVAIPHGKDSSVRQITVAAGTSKQGVDFQSIDGKPAHLIFLVLAQANNPGPHLQALSEIAACLNVPGEYDKLIAAKTPQEFLRLLAEVGSKEAL